jgi:flagellar L-ring protein precursor FlgH
MATLSGCNSNPRRDPAFAATRPVAIKPADYQNGAIYQAGYDMTLFEDRRARRVGDLLTINLQESTNASKDAETEIQKDTDINVTTPTVLGSAVQFSTPGFLPLADTKNNNLNVELGSNHSFDGSGSSSQSNTLSGSITVTVAEVLPNGYLVVRGEKVYTLNQGDEHIRIQGIVRPDDIAADNTISSTKVADAEIIYSGRGSVQDSNVLGWLAKFFVSALLPF